MPRFASSIKRFRPQNRSCRQLPLPAASNVRVAQVSALSTSFDSVESFCRDRWDELETFRPAVLVGSTADLRGLAELVQRQVLDLTSVDHVIFVLTVCGEQPVSDVLRVVLWQAFGVPVYELFVGAEGRLFASECEAHEGWHIEPCVTFSITDGELILHAPEAIGVATGLTGHIDAEPCPCGRASLRVRDIEALTPIDDRALAATA
jgi:hypothetical protein